MGSISLTPTLTAKKTAAQGGGNGRGGPVDFYRGDGGGGRGDGTPDYGERLRRYRLGLAVGLTSVVMVFVSFTSAYIVRQGLGTWDFTAGRYVHDWQKLHLPLALLLLNTGILLASTITMEMARRRAAQDVVLAPVTSMPGISEGHQRPVPWLWITVVLGLGFLAGQGLAWNALVQRGLLISSNPSSSFFYLLTGTHAAHLAGGIIALLYASIISSRLFKKPVETRRIVVDITAWYWHVMALLWIYIFALMAFAG